MIPFPGSSSSKCVCVCACVCVCVRAYQYTGMLNVIVRLLFLLCQPSLPIKKRSDLGKLLRRYDEQGLGGVLMSDIAEALPNPEKVLKV